MKYWVTRDKDGELNLFSSEPKKFGPCWIVGFDYELRLDDKLFPEVTFENSPMEVELKLVK